MKALFVFFIASFISCQVATARTPENRRSEDNTTTIPLASSATFPGSYEICDMYDAIIVSVKTDLEGTLKVNFSPDGTNTDRTFTYQVKAGVVEPPHVIKISEKWCEVTFTNDGAGTQNYLRLQTMYGESSQLTFPISEAINPDADSTVVRNIDTEFIIGTGGFTGVTSIAKFGKNPDVGGVEDVWDGGGEFTGFPTGSAELVELLSTSGDDDEGGAGCEKMQIYGISAGLFADEEVTLNGITGVDSVSTYTRIYRAKCTQSANGANTSFNVGTITIRHKVTTANIFSTILPGVNQTQVCAMSVPSDKTGFLKEWGLEVSKKTTANVEAAIVVYDGGVGVTPPKLWRPFTSSQISDQHDSIYGAYMLVAGTDIKMRVIDASTTGIDVHCHMDIFFVDNI